MKIVFISNYMNHHQLPFSQAMCAMPEVDYCFIATNPVSTERLELGYQDMDHQYGFVFCAYEGEEERKKAIRLCNTADVVIWGSAPKEYVKERLKQKKLTFCCSERIYKVEPPVYQMPLRLIKYFWDYGRHKNLYMLCASAYTAADYARTYTFLGKTYKWGYFPELKKYDDLELLMKKKEIGRILWVGRMTDWKHPEMAIEVARRLKEDGCFFQLEIVGIGAMKEELEKKVIDHNLSDCIAFLGPMSPKDVRLHMEKAQIYLFTSDRREGWGAVLNESMNSGCAVVASEAIGSVPFLIQNGKNGYIYQAGDIDDFYAKVKKLLEDAETSCSFGKNAYYTLFDEWNAEVAAHRFVKLATAVLNGEKKPNLFKSGVCSVSK